MSRRARTRRDRRVILNPVQVAMQGVALLADEDRTALQRIADNALLAYSCGDDCATQWCVLADAMNVAETLARAGICSDAGSQRYIWRAQAALSAAYGRHQERNTWAMRGPELVALGDGVLIHRIQLEHCSVREYCNAVEATKERMRQALAGNAPAGARVLVGNSDRAER